MNGTRERCAVVVENQMSCVLARASSSPSQNSSDGAYGERERVTEEREEKR